MNSGVISPILIKMIDHKHTRKLLAKKIDAYVYKSIVDDDSEDLGKIWETEYLNV